MKKLCKYFMMITCVMIMMMNSLMTNVKASSTFYVNGVPVHYTDFSSQPGHCWAYANNMYQKIWGISMVGQASTSNLLSELSLEESRLTEENLKNYVSAAALGSVIRVTNYEGMFTKAEYYGHSQVIVQKDENGFTVVEGGMSTPPHIREHYYTWNEYCTAGWLGGKYGYIKYIIWPNAKPYQPIDEVKEQEIMTYMGELETIKNETNLSEKVLSVASAVELESPTQTFGKARQEQTPTISTIYEIEDCLGLTILIVSGALYKFMDYKYKTEE